jgi:hypothetical protein
MRWRVVLLLGGFSSFSFQTYRNIIISTHNPQSVSATFQGGGLMNSQLFPAVFRCSPGICRGFWLLSAIFSCSSHEITTKSPWNHQQTTMKSPSPIKPPWNSHWITIFSHLSPPQSGQAKPTVPIWLSSSPSPVLWSRVLRRRLGARKREPSTNRDFVWDLMG